MATNNTLCMRLSPSLALLAASLLIATTTSFAADNAPLATQFDKARKLVGSLADKKLPKPASFGETELDLFDAMASGVVPVDPVEQPVDHHQGQAPEPVTLELHARERERAALALDAGYLPALVNMAEFEGQRGRFPAAVALLERAVAAHPESATAHHALGLTLARAGRSTAALPSLSRAAELAPDEPRYAYVRAIALNSLGQRADARQTLRDALARHPRHRDSLLALATMERDAGNRAEAERLAEAFRTEPYHGITAAGGCWAEAWYYGMCILEEMQWIRTRPVQAAERAHQGGLPDPGFAGEHQALARADLHAEAGEDRNGGVVGVMQHEGLGQIFDDDQRRAHGCA